ncbi:hypothetical protein [Chryseobacterium sediminis]|uniref:Uncharacterized protein n=1 Tax=Chryseobacterium sediminis TaxID=1679494 RepID=A0A5B2UDS8_9FLAO|nr:hypothetical protein [Chryseobacterium sediminis]KAA2224682.1 hypothetical protein FW780_10895 [Chryseobacterium sediminis]
MKSIVTCLILLLAASPLFSQKSETLEQLFSTYEKAGLFSGSILIAEKVMAIEMRLKNGVYDIVLNMTNAVKPQFSIKK